MATKETTQAIYAFNGQKDDVDPKLLPLENHSAVVNFNFNSNGGNSLDQIYFPTLYLSPTDLTLKYYLGVAADYNGNVDYVGDYVLQRSTGSTLYHVIVVNKWIYLQKPNSNTDNYRFALASAGKCSCVVYNNKLFVANGQEYPWVVDGGSFAVPRITQMGAPIIDADDSLTYKFRYAMTYVTDGDEKVLGTVSAVVSTSTATPSLVLYLPLGYQGTLQRKIYRQDYSASPTGDYKLVATIADNTTLTYTDTAATGTLGATIPAINNECPKPYFVAVANGQLYGAKNDKNPTQVYVTDEGYEVWNWSNYIDVSNHADDNTPVNGIGTDFSSVIVGTGNNMYFLSPSTANIGATAVTPSRAYCGVKSGYTMRQIPSFGDFPGGLAFVSTMNDVRIMVGLDALPVVTTIGNVRTQNFSRNIQATLNADFISYSNIYAEFYDYKYHLVVDGIKYVFDVRYQGWTTHNITTAHYASVPRVLGVMNFGTLNAPIYYLMNGQAAGLVEQEYSYQLEQYKSENCTASLTSGYISASRELKQITKLAFWIKSGSDTHTSTCTVTVTLDDDTTNNIVSTFTIAAAKATNFYTVSILRSCLWMKYKFECTAGNVSLQMVEIVGEKLVSRES